MSEGSPRLTFRIPAALLAEVQREMHSQEQHSANMPEDVTAFVLRSVEQRIAKRQRSRAKRRKRVPTDAEGWPLLRYEVVGVND